MILFHALVFVFFGYASTVPLSNMELENNLVKYINSKENNARKGHDIHRRSDNSKDEFSSDDENFSNSAEDDVNISPRFGHRRHHHRNLFKPTYPFSPYLPPHPVPHGGPHSPPFLPDSHKLPFPHPPSYDQFPCHHPHCKDHGQYNPPKPYQYDHHYPIHHNGGYDSYPYGDNLEPTTTIKFAHSSNVPTTQKNIETTTDPSYDIDVRLGDSQKNKN